MPEHSGEQQPGGGKGGGREAEVSVHVGGGGGGRDADGGGGQSVRVDAILLVDGSVSSRFTYSLI